MMLVGAPGTEEQVEELIRIHDLDASYAARLPVELRAKFAELVQSAAEQRDDTE